MSDFYLQLGKREYHNVDDFVQDYWDDEFNLDNKEERERVEFVLIKAIEYYIVKGKVDDEVLRLMEKMDYLNTAVDKNVYDYDIYDNWLVIDYIFEIDNEFYVLRVDESPDQERTMAWSFTQPCKVRKKTIEKIVWEEMED